MVRSPRSIHPAGVWFAVGMLVLFVIERTVANATGAVEDDWDIAIGISLTGILGAYLVAKRPENRISWLLAWIGIIGVAGGIADSALPDGTVNPSDAQLILNAVGLGLFFGTFWLFLGVYPLLFPTGRTLTPRWRIVGWVGSVSWLFFAVGGLLQGEICLQFGLEGTPDDGTCLMATANPIGIEGVEMAEFSSWGSVLLVLLLVSIAAAFVSMVVRYRRSGGLERRQMKLLLLAFGFGLATLLIKDVLLDQILGITTPQPVSFAFNLVGWMMIPIATAIAILRHGLYEIDRVISRTVSYLLIVIVVGALFTTIVVGLPNVAGLDSNLAVAGATLMAFFVFSPLLKRIQRRVDRVFNRQPYNAHQVLEDFGSLVRDEVDPERLAETWISTVSDTLEPSSIGVWIKDG